jgi:peptidyl-prolyl cis-trans isomerase A (cyclophilin A)
MKALSTILCALTLALLPGCQAKEDATTGEPGPPAATAAKGPRVRLETSLGSIVLELNEKDAPLSAANFLQYVKDGFYNGTVFHRVIDGFMIQGGGMELQAERLVEKQTRAPIANEAANGLKNDRGTIAMARTNNPNSATAQFFINVADNAGLNRPNPDGHGYAVFGRVVEGMETVDKIKAVATGAQDVPMVPVVIKSAAVVQ